MKLQMMTCAQASLVGLLVIVAVPVEAQVYRSCDDARAAGRVPLFRGEPGYDVRLDQDNDGIACEILGPRRARTQVWGQLLNDPPILTSIEGTVETTARDNPDQDGNVVRLPVGSAEAITTDRAAHVVIIGNTDVAAAAIASDKVIAVTAKTVGSTNLIALDKDGVEILRTSVLVRTALLATTATTATSSVRRASSQRRRQRSRQW